MEYVFGNIVGIRQRTIFPGRICLEKGYIKKIEPWTTINEQYILPGFIDAHVHIESSMLVPAEFAKIAVTHGTVATVSDPHEIANVLGKEGVYFMIENGKSVPFKFFFGAPSCVPATSFETAGAELKSADIYELLSRPEIKYLSEMMNYPGVLSQDPEIWEKLKIAKSLAKPVDGHAPGLKGKAMETYFAAGITTDHECFSYGEALAKAKQGVKILVREGSAAKNYQALIPLLKSHPRQIMFCSDDKHPDDLVKSHINESVKRAIQEGYDLFDVLRAACINPVEHYKLEVGTLRAGDPGDFIVVSDLQKWDIRQTYINGNRVAHDGQANFGTVKKRPINRFQRKAVTPEDFSLLAESETIRVIESKDGALMTGCRIMPAYIKDQKVESDPNRDILKIAVINRYQNTRPAIGFIRNFGIERGSIASSVGHDSHNIVVIGTMDSYMTKAANLIIQQKGGISAVSEAAVKLLPLPVAGIMSAENGYQVAKAYSEIDAFVKHTMGSTLQAPFMTLSFMALLVIPSLKLSDRGLFDGDKFRFIDLFVKKGD